IPSVVASRVHGGGVAPKAYSLARRHALADRHPAAGAVPGDLIASRGARPVGSSAEHRPDTHRRSAIRLAGADAERPESPDPPGHEPGPGDRLQPTLLSFAGDHPHGPILTLDD